MPEKQLPNFNNCDPASAFDDMDREDLSDDRLEGAKEIRACYARNKSLAWIYRMLESGQIPARKENGAWTTYKSVLRFHRRRLVAHVPVSEGPVAG